MIVVTTPTGSIGHQALEHVIRAGAPVRVVARDPSRLPAAVHEHAEVVKGATNDPAALAEALTGADTVLWVLPPDPRAASIHAHVVDFTLPLCDAIAAQGVRRVVAVSSLGRAVGRNAGQISAAFAMDHLVESTGVHYRSLGMPGFMENTLRQLGPIRDQGLFFGTLPADRKSPTVATRDIAAVAAGLLLDPDWTGQKSVAVPGPEDLSPDDMAGIMTEELGRPVAYRQIPGEALVASMTEHGTTRAWAQGLVDMSAAVDAGLYDAEPYPDRAATTPTTFRQWCREVLRPALA
ncbi:NmrA family NAD(P)-binding protein [Streptomyces sp. NRRL F-5123]|uniref:NmrA family NAD(P)-binding protein n=1 Tax=Streptomyces sp. NRRL F-5123 TaxID=1463856 RepID=UPI0004E1D807|nr:NAD(P)H-binding protein [Streptomyces sp. NRRL F-5123]